MITKTQFMINFNLKLIRIKNLFVNKMKSYNSNGILIKFDYNKPSIFFWIGLSGPVFVEVITLTVITISGDNCN